MSYATEGDQLVVEPSHRTQHRRQVIEPVSPMWSTPTTAAPKKAKSSSTLLEFPRCVIPSVFFRISPSHATTRRMTLLSDPSAMRMTDAVPFLALNPSSNHQEFPVKEMG